MAIEDVGFAVTEADFRLPKYRNAKVEDYEWRADGELVRKDRWETGIHRIAVIVYGNSRDFEIDELVESVRAVFKTESDDD